MKITKILLIVFIVLTVACGGMAGWFYHQYSQEKDTAEQYLNMYNTANTTAEQFINLYHTANTTAERYWGMYTTSNMTAKQYWDMYVTANSTSADWKNKYSQLMATAITDPKILNMFPSYYKTIDWLELLCLFKCDNAEITAIDATPTANSLGKLTILFSGTTITFDVFTDARWFSGQTVQMSDFKVGDVIGVELLYTYLARSGVSEISSGFFYHQDDDIDWG